jgi:tRNA(Arg) A34 adenosine deaminase TadA
MLFAQLHLTLPPWVLQLVDDTRPFPDDASRMALALELARTNVARRSGGPFGAAVFNAEGRLVSVGVNRVVTQNCSAAHAEIMALMLGQQRLQRFRLNEDGGRYALYTSAQPCSQCYGATLWAGISELVIGARAEDVERLAGFDEGPLPQDWVGELERRGIAVRRDLQRDAACTVLSDYAAQGGERY